MTWREAFLDQARSDESIRQLLIREQAEYAHQLHYLQMVTEKLGKALGGRAGDADPPELTHAVFVKLLRTLRSRPELRRRLGYADTAAFHRFIDSLLPIARQIEELAPAIAGTTSPNAEYPWISDGAIQVPARYAFPLLPPHNPQMNKIERLLAALLKSPL